ncbi:DUF2922 domain-containing protein [Clostridium magnum]|jgi:Protein of unknown function (DUF2922).|uniref:DUF2922 domain-containing protein n=1 Tax=Clostridium magnum DSM 2767 TaxID=1121326 RepID=A0A161WU61_9CLOT|nr:DUF2922 domain-containing protein [Clostridium magnum]KZL90398.1 hypothetical protein CLMAG_41690 [Clostridium magnum DSM 2767]SHH84145.1 Protein of unknown function [Clostridium magnum DSM 2767]
MSKTLVMNFLNDSGSKTAIRVNNVKDGVTEAEVGAAMDVIIAKNIFTSTGGDLRTKDSAEIVDKTSTELTVK